MRSSKKKPSRAKQWSAVPPPIVPDWEAAHIFLAVARSGSFRAAAQELGQSVNALRRKIDQFEKELEVSLLSRHVNGVQLTEEGSKIYAAVQRMESASFNLLQARNLSEQQVEGEVRLSVTEGIGSGWILPQLGEFQRANPRLVMNLRCEPRPADLFRLEADVAIQLQRPEEPDLKVVKLGRLHLMFFGSKSYFERHGYSTDLSDPSKHRFVVLTDDAGRWEELYRSVFPGHSPAGLVVLRSNVSSTHFWSVAQGIGIGALPSYVKALGADLVPIEWDLGLKVDVWLTYRADAKRIARVRKTIDWLVQAFDPRCYPWFRDEFVHPDRFAELYKGPVIKPVLLR